MTRAGVIVPFLILPAFACANRASSAPTETTTIPAGATFAVSGVVRGGLPSGGIGVAVSDAQIDVEAESGKIARTATDSDGAYAVRGVAGRVQVRFLRVGYETKTVVVGPAATDQRVDVALTPIPARLTGVVVQASPGGGRPLTGARVEVTTGPNAGKAVLTDASGRYTLTDVWSALTLRFTRDGFEQRTQFIAVDGKDTVVDAELTPSVNGIVETYEYGGLFGPPPFRIAFDVHTDGQVAIVDFSGYGFEQGDGTMLQIWEDGRLAGQAFAERSAPRHTILVQVPASAGRTYEVRTLSVGIARPQTITISHPR